LYHVSEGIEERGVALVVQVVLYGPPATLSSSAYSSTVTVREAVLERLYYLADQSNAFSDRRIAFQRKPPT
jgi:hypothetical protein